jgi:cell division transport system permease protein
MAMKINTFKHFIGDAAKSLKRNRAMSTAAVATVAATLFVLGLFMLTILNIQQVMKEVESKVEIKVILKDDIKINEQKELEKAIKDTVGVQDITFESKSQALENLRNQLGEQNKSLVEGLDKENPMPNSYIIKVTKPEIVVSVVDNIKSMPGIEVIKDGREIVDKIIAISNTIKWVGIAIFAILIGVSLFLIGNTIKLTVYARRREIGIMKYIGATDWFIRWPFIIEGAVIGVLGALIANGLLYFGYNFIYTKVSSQMLIMQLVNPTYILSTIVGEFLLGGVLIGVIGSILAIRKFLAV